LPDCAPNCAFATWALAQIVRPRPVITRMPLGPPTEPRARGDRLRLDPTGLASVEPRAPNPYALAPWGILVIRSGVATPKSHDDKRTLGLEDRLMSNV
jgi:hypothetical protein